MIRWRPGERSSKTESWTCWPSTAMVAPPETPRRKRRASRSVRRAGCEAGFGVRMESSAAGAMKVVPDAAIGGGGTARETVALSTGGMSGTAVDSRGRPVPTPPGRCSERDSASRRCHTSVNVPMRPSAATPPRTILRRLRCGGLARGRRVGGVGAGGAGGGSVAGDDGGDAAPC